MSFFLPFISELLDYFSFPTGLTGTSQKFLKVVVIKKNILVLFSILIEKDAFSPLSMVYVSCFHMHLFYVKCMYCNSLLVLL